MRSIVLGGVAWLAGLGPLAPSAQAQCANVYHEGFGSGVLPLGWEASGAWHLTNQGSCTSWGCFGGFYAFFADGAAGYSCTCVSPWHACDYGTLRTPPITLPTVASGEQLLLDFCADTWLDGVCWPANVPSICNRVEVRSAALQQTFILGPHVYLNCNGLETRPPYDVTAFAGQVVRISWTSGCVDSHGSLMMRIDDVRIDHVVTGPDCNANLVPDACEIASGSSADCDLDGVPDECQPDCNMNGVADPCDLSWGSSVDCDANGVPDECQRDCNMNGIADPCDIASGAAGDCNGNLIPDSCDGDDIVSCLSQPNSTGVPANLTTSGTRNVSCNDFGLVSAHGPPGEVGSFFYGAGSVHVPFGAGILCVAAPAYRLDPPVAISDLGIASYALDLTSLPPDAGIVAGSAWYFQLIFRDGSASGAGWNTSHGRRVVFAP